MPVMRWSSLAAVAAVALTISGAAHAVGPWPGLASAVVSPDGHVRYTASRSAESTTVRARTLGAGGAVIATTKIDGLWGIPAITSTGVAGGLSPDGRVLVLAQPPTYNGLRKESRLVLLSTKTLALRETVVLKGEFGFDAFSPDGRTLYLIQHKSVRDLVAYVVRGYDLGQKRLLPGAIVAKGESENMRGYPVARATRAQGAWVYTLYTRQTGKPFIHALATNDRYAVCIDLPWAASPQQIWTTRLSLSRDGRKLLVRSGGTVVARVDTRSFRVT
jgi:DNA-binding beta-propeller fold protein YncE